MIELVTFYLVLLIPGAAKPVMHAKEDVTIEECLDDVHYVLGKLNPEWPKGTVLQAGCSAKVADKTDIKQ